MSMHYKPLTSLERIGLEAHHLPIGEPSQLSDTFRLGVEWALNNSMTSVEDELPPETGRYLVAGTYFDTAIVTYIKYANPELDGHGKFQFKGEDITDKVTHFQAIPHINLIGKE